MSRTTGKVESAGTVITLEDATDFPPQGYVKIGRELVKYTSKDGSRLLGCERGLLGDKPEHGKPGIYNPGQWVVNYAAWAIAYYPVSRHPGEFTLFSGLDVSDISRLADLDPEILVIADAEDKVVLANAQAGRLFGYFPHQMIGRDVEMLIPQRFRDAHHR